MIYIDVDVENHNGLLLYRCSFYLCQVSPQENLLESINH